MRSLVILRGSPGSGKSTWIKQMGLENYTLCADTLRLLVQSPILVPECKHRTVNQRNDSYVWQLLFELLEKRMMNGEFVIIDATHSRSSDFSRYNKLCERYRYRRYYVDFSDVPIEECKRRNLQREDYKQVPESVIDKMYSRLQTQGKTSGWVEVDKNHFWEQIGTKLFDMDKYKRINVFGDIHGCFEPLKEYFSRYPFSEEEMYIFCGDYTDRGIQNKETLEFLLSIYEKKNVLFLEGNHEIWLNHWALDEEESIKSKTFLFKTAKELEGIDKKEVRKFYRSLGQLAYFKYDNKKYLITHGGLSYVPDELQLVATQQLIKGVGDYNTQIDEVFSSNEEEIIQIHGHRNTFKTDYTEQSYNLEDRVEFGGNLRVVRLEKGFIEPMLIKIKNDYFAPEEIVNEFGECKSIEHPYDSIIEELRRSKYIVEKKIDENISSFNFSRNCFYNKTWNKMTCKARGLYIDTEKDKVVARGYEKFFNINETRESELEHLLIKFKDKITCYKKENGFLGIMSYVNGELFLASKSSNSNDFADYFKKIFEESSINKDNLIKYLKENDVSLVFEVIDVDNDPHIIKYDKSKIILLDIIHNEYEFKKEPYEEVQRLAEYINCECKTIYKEFDNIRDFHRWYLESTDEENMTHEDIEGVVIESSGIMTKLKFPYYNFWKLMRGIKEGVSRGGNINLSKLYNAEANYFYAWLRQQNQETLQKDIITLRDMYNIDKHK